MWGAAISTAEAESFVRYDTAPSGNISQRHGIITHKACILEKQLYCCLRVKLWGMGNCLISTFQRKCITVGAKYPPSDPANTSDSSCSIYTSDKYITSSTNYFATIAKAASLLWISLFGSSTYFSLRSLIARQNVFVFSLFWNVKQRRLVLSYRRFGR